ncbi:MAG: metalloregulator ArsR/SmtB family transcription factor [Dehalococcoidia bacterium]
MSNDKIDSIVEYADIFKALSNPKRLQIYIRLVHCNNDGLSCCSDERNYECAGDLGKDLDISPSTVSHHLKELYRAGLIKTARHARRIRVRADQDALKSLADFFASNGIKQYIFLPF